MYVRLVLVWWVYVLSVPPMQREPSFGADTDEDDDEKDDNLLPM